MIIPCHLVKNFKLLIHTFSKWNSIKYGVHEDEMEEEDKSGFLVLNTSGTATLVNPLPFYK